MSEYLQREILDKLRGIEDKLERLEKARQKRYLPFEACIPPKQLCEDLVKTYALSCLSTWEHQMQILSDYYGIQPMKNYHQAEKVSANAIACYHASESSAYYKKPTAELSTVLHEFFHHLVAQGVVYVGNKSEEKLADQYVQIILILGK